MTARRSCALASFMSALRCADFFFSSPCGGKRRRLPGAVRALFALVVQADGPSVLSPLHGWESVRRAAHEARVYLDLDY